MSDLFRTGKAKRKTSGSFSVSADADLVKKLKKLEHGGETAIKRTVSDFASRAPAWVSQGVRQHYGVDASAVKEAAERPKRGKTSITVAGIAVDGVTLVYRGRTLTPIHFKMSPKQRPTARKVNSTRIPGQAIAGEMPVAMIKQPKKYRVKATIIKGSRSKLPPGTFLAEGKGGVLLPFQRTGEGRMPIEVVRTLSVPQMIDGRASETIENKLSTELEKRFNHHIERAKK